MLFELVASAPSHGESHHDGDKNADNHDYGNQNSGVHRFGPLQNLMRRGAANDVGRPEIMTRNSNSIR
jgi:hypothetical protein